MQQSHTKNGKSSGDSHLDEILPLNRSRSESMCWQLGKNITDADDARLTFEATNEETGCELSVYDVTTHTYIVQFRTPVGREKFYDVAKEALHSMRQDIHEDEMWQLQRGSLQLAR